MKYYTLLFIVILFSCQSTEDEAFEAFEGEDYETALEKFSEVAAMNPRNWYHLFNVARSMEELGRYDEAIRWYGKSLKYNPDAEEILLARGRCLVKTLYYSGAYTDVTRVLEINPKNAEAHKLMGQMALAENDLWAALNHFNSAIFLNPDDINLYYHRAIVMGTIGNSFGAISDLNHVISKRRDFNQAYYNRGILFMRSHQFNKAIEDFDKAEELDYAPAELYVRRGECRSMLNRRDNACGDYMRAAELDKRYKNLVAEGCQ